MAIVPWYGSVHWALAEEEGMRRYRVVQGATMNDQVLWWIHQCIVL